VGEALINKYSKIRIRDQLPTYKRSPSTM